MLAPHTPRRRGSMLCSTVGYRRAPFPTDFHSSRGFDQKEPKNRVVSKGISTGLWFSPCHNLVCLELIFPFVFLWFVSSHRLVVLFSLPLSVLLFPPALIDLMTPASSRSLVVESLQSFDRWWLWPALLFVCSSLTHTKKKPNLYFGFVLVFTASAFGVRCFYGTTSDPDP